MLSFLKKILRNNEATIKEDYFAEEPKPVFIKDNKIKIDSQEGSKASIKWVKETYGYELDKSRDSVQIIEKILDHIHKTIPNDDPTLEEKIRQFVSIFGSYIGEVYINSHNASWGIIQWDGMQYPGIECKDTDNLFWPHGRVEKRIREGAENNVWHYYQNLDREVAKGSAKS
jgi:hypothetical protein